MEGYGLSSLGPTVGLSGLPDPMGDATGALEARRRQQVTAAGYPGAAADATNPFEGILSALGPTINERAVAAREAMRRGDMATANALNQSLALDFGQFLGSIKPIRAFHGSPHDFDRFSMDKIGTGEGAQAYGHGLYFAENEGVARSYRDALGGRINPYDRRALDDAWVNAAKSMYADNMKPDEIAAVLKQSYRGITEKQISDTIQHAFPGRMYEVDIHADPSRFLDWDAPIQNLPDDVVSAARAVGARPRGGWEASALEPNIYYRKGERGTEGSVRLIRGWREDIPDQWIAEYDTGLSRGSQKFDSMDLAQRWIDTEAPIEAGRGADVVREMQRRMSDAQVTDALRDAGIPGIKYLDQGSRSAGDGSRNYVVFDDKIVEILRKYGIMAPVAGAGLSALSLGDEDGM